MSTTTEIMTRDYGKLLEFSENECDKNIDLIEKGDVLFFHRQSLTMDHPTFYNKYPGHCGIYLGERKFIHATAPAQMVVISDFNYNPYWYDTLVGVKDFVSDEKVLVKKNTSNY